MAKPKLRDGAYDNSPREPMEVLAMLAGKSSYVVPTEGKSTSTTRLEPKDVAQALGIVDDKLGATLALAIACEMPHLFPKVQELGLERIRNHLRLQDEHNDITTGPKAYRVRLLLYDVFQDLLWPRRRMSMNVAAQVYGIRRGEYDWLHHHTTGFTRDIANAAARQACRYLFAPDRPPPAKDSPPDENKAAEAVACMHARAVSDQRRMDVLAMIDAWRPITPGLLTLDSVLMRAQKELG